MLKDQLGFSEAKDNAVINLWKTIRLIKHANSLSTDEFLDTYNDRDAISNVFTGSQEDILNRQAIPVMVCAKNEMINNNIGITLLALSRQRGVNVQPVVINNGSIDGTGQMAEHLGAIVLTEGNIGLMNALKRGFQYFSEINYQGPILHTDADAAPLELWAATMLDHATSTLPYGGESFGPVFYFDSSEKLYSGKNSLLTMGAAVRDIRGRRQGEPVARGPNGVIMTDTDGKILEALSEIQNPIGAPHMTDIVIRDTIKTLGATNSCGDRQATVVVSGRRYPRMLDVVKRSVSPVKTRLSLYNDWQLTLEPHE